MQRAAPDRQIARENRQPVTNRSNGRDAMTRHTYDKEITALLVIDPYRLLSGSPGPAPDLPPKAPGPQT